MNKCLQSRLANINKDTLSKFGRYIPYVSIIIGSAIAFLSGIYSQGFLFYALSIFGLIIALLGKYTSSFIEDNIKIIAEKDLLERKLTPPKFIVNLKYQDNRKYLVLIQSENLIPMEFKVAILNDQNVFLSGIQLDWAEIYPKEGNRNFKYAISLNKNPTAVIKLKFDYRSIGSGEMNKKELEGSLTQRYKLVQGGIEFLN